VVKTFVNSAEKRAQLLFDLRGTRARNPNQLLAAGFSGGYRNRRARNIQKLRDELDAGLVGASLSASPCVPVMAFLRARGFTLTWNVAPAGVSWMEIKASREFNEFFKSIPQRLKPFFRPCRFARLKRAPPI